MWKELSPGNLELSRRRESTLSSVFGILYILPPKMSLCRSCLHRLSQSSKLNLTGRPLAQARFISYSHTFRIENDELSKAKARAWYLDPTPSASSAPTPSSSSKRTPKFTTFDPESTRSDIETEQIHPLPPNATSPLLITLHEHLTRQSDSVESGSVRFLHAPSSQLVRPRSEGDEEGYSALLGESGGTNWEWVVTCQVKGRGRGVLNRAEKEIRKWVCPLSLLYVISSDDLANDRCVRVLERGRDRGLHLGRKVIRIGQ
jgi:hypothetical protein